MSETSQGEGWWKASDGRWYPPERQPGHTLSTEDQIAKLASAKLSMKIGVRKELARLPTMLGDREQVENLAGGRYDGRNGLVVLTDRRVMFVEEGMMRSKLEDFPYERVSSVQTEKTMMAGKLVIFVSGNKAVIDNVLPKERAVEIGDAIRARITSAPPTPSTAEHAGVPSSSIADELKKLAELRDAGVLSEDEFAAQKAKLLD